MNTPCPHCQAEIEIDAETLAALEGHKNFQCPSCGGEVPVPTADRPRVKVKISDLVIPNQSASNGNSASSAKSPKRGIDPKLIILGATVLIFLSGFIVYLNSRPSKEPPVAKITFPSRAELDAKLVFEANTSAFLGADDSYAFEGYVPEIDEQRVFPVYKELWGEKQVFAIHPLAIDKHGSVNFSKITEHAKGTLTLKARNHPKGDCRVEIMKSGGVALHNIDVNNNEWKTMRVPFDHEAVSLLVHANGWSCEYAFITYSIE